MSESKHTPGPWKASDNGSFWDIDSRQGKIGDVCASAHLDKGDNQKANAALIAAAPELLEAVKDLRDELCDAECPSQCGHPHCKGCRRDAWKRKRIVEVDALIAKAEGE